MNGQTQSCPDLVVAVGPAALGVLARVAGWSAGSAERPLLLGLTAQYPPADLQDAWRDVVYDLGPLENHREVFRWIRQASDGGQDLPAWLEPLEECPLSPAQCRHLYRFHDCHGLISAFWRMALPERVGSVHLVARLSDGAASLISKVAAALRGRLDGSGMLHVHALLPRPAGVYLNGRQTELACAGSALARLARLASRDSEPRRAFWLLREMPASEAGPLAEVASLVGRLTTARRPDPLLGYCCHLQRIGAWRATVGTVWGSYRCFGDGHDGVPSPEELSADDWLEGSLPASRVDLMRRILVHWGAPPPWRRAAIGEDPGLHEIDASDGQPEGRGCLLCRAWLGFLPAELADWDDFHRNLPRA